MLNLNDTSILTNFNLKNMRIDLISSGSRSIITDVFSVEQLEALRTHPARLFASKFGLEVICGASCDTGAQ